VCEKMPERKRSVQKGYRYGTVQRGSYMAAERRRAVMASREISPYTGEDAKEHLAWLDGNGDDARSEPLDCIVNRLLQIERLGKPDQFR